MVVLWVFSEGEAYRICCGFDMGHAQRGVKDDCSFWPEQLEKWDHPLMRWGKTKGGVGLGVKDWGIGWGPVNLRCLLDAQ